MTAPSAGQTNVIPSGQPLGLAGQLFDSAEAVDIVSFFNSEADDIPFGRAVAQSLATVAQGIEAGKLPDASDNVIIGLNVFGYNHMPVVDQGGDLGDTGLAQNGSGQLARLGRFLAEISPDVASINMNDRGYVCFEDYTGSGATAVKRGMFSKANTGSHYIDATTQVVFRSTLFSVTYPDGSSKKLAVASLLFNAKP